MGQSKISLKELASVRRKTAGSIDDYLNRFRLLKARCFAQVPEHELVEMAAGGLDYSIRKKLDTQYLRDMAQLADRVRQVERLKAEKERASKYGKKEKVAYVDTNDSDQDFDIDWNHVEESEVNIAELKPGPPFVCKFLKPSNGKNHEEPKNDRFVSKTYTFDVTKCDEIFDLLVNEGIMIVPKGLKLPHLEQRQKRGYCKFHGNFGHNTSRCVVFRDSKQKALDKHRLKFADKQKQTMQVEVDPLKKADSMYLEITGMNMVEITEIDLVITTDGLKIDVEMATEGHKCVDTIITEDQYQEKIQVVFPKAKEDLIDFLNRCKIYGSPVMSCPRCSAIFDKKAMKNVEGFLPQSKRKGKWANERPKFSFENANIPFKDTSPTANQKKGQVKTFTPPSNEDQGTSYKSQEVDMKGVGGPMTRARVKKLRENLEDQISLFLDTKIVPNNNPYYLTLSLVNIDCNSV